MLMAIRSMHKGWMIHREEHLNGVPPIHFRYLDHVDIRYVLEIRTWESLVGLRGALPVPAHPKVDWSDRLERNPPFDTKR
ncbi:hypothetical protein NC652_030194 [Populus alba x Populus x berolinensis]|nr:hypothetical protein NC652_030194 [Populus alba x Populus x berolinensis]